MKTTTNAAALAPLVNAKTVCQLTGFSRRHLYTLVQAGAFPKPVKLSARRIAWREADLVRWMESRQQVAWAA